MKKTSGILSILLAVLMVVTLTVTAVSAADSPDPNVSVEPDPGYSGEPAAPVEPDPGYSDDPGVPVEPDPGYSDDPGVPVEPDPGYSDDPNAPAENGGSDTDPAETPQYFYDDEDPLWFGDPADYSYNYNSGDNNVSAGSVSDSTKLFDTSGMDRADVTPNKWTDITLDEKTTKAGGSFSAIKSNTAKDDNGQWILYLGYALVILAVLGILYFITATVSARKQNARELRHNAGAGSSSAYTKLEKTESGSKSKSSSGHYADGYDNYSSRKDSKADTGEVYVPRRAK